MDSYTHLLDTNIVSDLVRHPQEKAAQCLTLVDPYRDCTSLIVVSELRYGVEKKALRNWLCNWRRCWQGLIYFLIQPRQIFTTDALGPFYYAWDNL